jgi:hypothetical protein
MTIARRVRPALVVAAIAAVVIAWAAVPASGGRAGFKPVLIASLVCALFTVLTLLVPAPGAGRRQSWPTASFLQRSWNSVRTPPWPQGLVVAVLGLEALHPARPWHTALLGVVLVGFLLTVHLAATAARPSVFRPQLRLLVAGFGLAALSAGAAMVPALGAGSGLLAVIAAIAAVVVAALALPL